MSAVRIAPEVADALATGSPVVCLETTLVAHGFPQGEGVVVGESSEAAPAAASVTRANGTSHASNSVSAVVMSGMRSAGFLATMRRKAASSRGGTSGWASRRDGIGFSRWAIILAMSVSPS